ncbi:MAG: RNA polymerase sigma factor [Nannocystales bacterium]
MVQEDDRTLLGQWRAGNADAGNALFRRHFASVRRFFRNKVSPDDVEDLIQRTFVGCVESQERFREDASFRTFLFAIARNQLFKFFRSRTSQRNLLDEDLGVSSVAAMGMTPSSIVAARQEHELLLLALQQVSVDEQTLLELFYWEALSGPEIAVVLQITAGAVRVRLHRARGKLQEAIERLMAPGQDFDLDAAAGTLRGL